MHFRIGTLIFALLITQITSLGYAFTWQQLQPTSQAYDQICHPETETPLTTQDKQLFKQMCQVVVKSEFCRDVSQKYRRNCTQDESFDLFDQALSCFQGFFDSLSDLWSFFKETLKLLFSPEKRESLSEEGRAFLDNLSTYYEIEKIKAKREMWGPGKDLRAGIAAGTKLLKTYVLKPLFKSLKGYYSHLACYNNKGKTKSVCQLLTDIFAPPLAVIGAFKKGPQGIKSLVQNKIGEPSSDRRGKTFDYGGLPFHESKPPHFYKSTRYKSESLKITSKTKPLGRKAPTKEERHLKENPIESVTPLNKGETESYTVELEDGTKAIFKPRQKHWGSNYRAEILAYQVDNYLDLGLVPATVERKIEGQLGSLQRFIPGTKSARNPLNKGKKSSLQKQHFLDFLIDHRDRHLGNYLISKDKNVVSIDNSLSFTGRGTYPQFFSRNEEEIVEFLLSDKGHKTMNRLKQLRSPKNRYEIKAYIGKEDTKRFYDRVDFMIHYYDRLMED